MSDADAAGARIEKAKMTKQDFAELLAYLRAESSQYPKNILQIKGSEAAALVAEIEAMRAEVERLKSMTAVTMGVGSGDGSLFVHGDYDSIKAAQALVFRAERLEEALKEIRNRTAMNLAMRPDPFALTALLGDIHQIAGAALAQENRVEATGNWPNVHGVPADAIERMRARWEPVDRAALSKENSND